MLTTQDECSMRLNYLFYSDSDMKHNGYELGECPQFNATLDTWQHSKTAFYNRLHETDGGHGICYVFTDDFTMIDSFDV